MTTKRADEVEVGDVLTRSVGKLKPGYEAQGVRDVCTVERTEQFTRYPEGRLFVRIFHDGEVGEIEAPADYDVDTE